MAIDDQIKYEKLQYNTNRVAAKISALSSKKFNKYEYLTGEEIIPSNQKQMIEQAISTNSPLGIAFKKQIKTIEGQGTKQVKALEDLKSKSKSKSIEGFFSQDHESVEIKNEVDKIKEYEEKPIEII